MFNVNKKHQNDVTDIRKILRKNAKLFSGNFCVSTKWMTPKTDKYKKYSDLSVVINLREGPQSR